MKQYSTSVVKYLLTTNVQVTDGGFEGWWKQFSSLRGTVEFGQELCSIHQAMIGGFHAEKLAYAFTTGYQTALESLLKRRCKRIAFCVSESKTGSHPRGIKTIIQRDAESGNMKLDGDKSFVSGGIFAEQLVIIARDGENRTHGNRNSSSSKPPPPKLVAILVNTDRTGISVVPREDTLPFIPEIPHARVHLRNVTITPSDILPGDGYTAYSKTFRTLEDIHIFSACVGYAFKIVRFHHTLTSRRKLIDMLITCVASLEQPSILHNPLSPLQHILLGAALSSFERFHQSELFQSSWKNEETSQQLKREWNRDSPLFNVAGGARGKRSDRAWESAKL